MVVIGGASLAGDFIWSLTYTDIAVPVGQTYSWYVKAFDASGNATTWAPSASTSTIDPTWRRRS